MKKNSFFVLVVVTLQLSLRAQVIYREDFSSVVLNGGVGHLPVTMSSARADTLLDSLDYRNVPFNDTAFSNEAWAVRTLDGNPCAIASALGQTIALADRWLFTPVITGNDSTTKLEWKNADYNPLADNWCTSYEVWATADTSSNPDPSHFTVVSSNNVYQNSAHIPGMNTTQVSLAAFAGAPLRIAFRLKEWNSPTIKWQVAIDDITVFNTTGIYNLSADRIYSNHYFLPGDTARICTIVTNPGQVISAYQWNISIGNFRDSIAVTTGILHGQSSPVLYYLVVPSLGPGEYQFTCWVSIPDGNADCEMLNDSIQQRIHIIGVPVNRNVLIEEFTGAWCGYCPDGGTTLDEITATRPWLVPVSIHTGDSMTLSYGQNVAFNFNYGFPSIVTDRNNVSGDYAYINWAQNDRSLWGTTADKRRVQPSCASVSVINQTYDWTTRALSVTVQVQFTDNAVGPFAVNCWLTEDNVFGPLNDTTLNHWNNTSYLNADSTSLFFGMGSVLDPSEYVHNDVLVLSLSGIGWGDTTLIPDTVLAGNTFQFTFTDTLPMSYGGAHIWIPQDMSVVSFVTLFDDYKLNQEVINTSEIPFNTAVRETEFSGIVSVYPNPAGAAVNLKTNSEVGQTLRVSIENLFGQTVVPVNTLFVSQGENNFTMQTGGFAAGLYYIRIESEQGLEYVPFIKAAEPE